MLPANRFDAVVIGGGFYGARLSLLLREQGRSVLLVEREPLLLGRASLRNQARVHHGYHYPRSILTSLRSRQSYARFAEEYAECVDRSFPHYYAIGRGASKVTASQFAQFCARIGAPLTLAPKPVRALFETHRIEAVFEAQECAFDAVRLRDRLTADLDAAGVIVRTSTEAEQVRTERTHTRVALRAGNDRYEVATHAVLNCTYSRLNRLLVASRAAPIPMKHELTELALVEPPPGLAGAAVTVMDGPFFSLMPYPSRGLFTLSHVRYTPHRNWHDGAASPAVDGDAGLAHARSRFMHMVRDAERYLPIMRGTRYVDSLFEIKTVMPRSEQDDSRPILYRRCAEHPGLVSVLGAKIDSVYEVEIVLRSELLPSSEAAPLATAGGSLSAAVPEPVAQ
jgi:glycine/D-amino acid oxidase-like deaminating enzyme